jgi:hypothetical protein
MVELSHADSLSSEHYGLKCGIHFTKCRVIRLECSNGVEKLRIPLINVVTHHTVERSAVCARNFDYYFVIESECTDMRSVLRRDTL